MLVLSRKKFEQIIIGDGAIVITVVEIRSDSVRIGVDADKAIPVHRREVSEAIKKKLRRNDERETE